MKKKTPLIGKTKEIKHCFLEFSPNNTYLNLTPVKMPLGEAVDFSLDAADLDSSVGCWTAIEARFSLISAIRSGFVP